MPRRPSFSVFRMTSQGWQPITISGQYWAGVGAAFRPDAAMSDAQHAEVERAAIWMFGEELAPVSVDVRSGGELFRVERERTEAV